MKEILIIEYIVNLIILLFFHMHMFQLNSYFFRKHSHWMKVNILKIIIQLVGISLPFILFNFKNTVTNILAILLLGFSIFYNFPKTKAKIPLKITNRVKRMLVTELILILLFSLVFTKYDITLILFIINVLSPILCIIANFINSPIEYIGKQRYINQAKKIRETASYPNTDAYFGFVEGSKYVDNALSYLHYLEN